MEILVQAGARVGGSDEGLAVIAVQSAMRFNDRKALHAWTLSGVNVGIDERLDENAKLRAK